GDVFLKKSYPRIGVVSHCVGAPLIQHAFDRVRRTGDIVAGLDARERRRDQHHQDRDDSDDEHYFDQRKSEALTQLWQRKSAKALTLSQREDTAGGERRHKLKRTTKPGNCESLKRPPSSRTRGTTAWQADE